MKIEINCTYGNIHYINHKGKKYYALYDLTVAGTYYPGKVYLGPHIITAKVAGKISKGFNCLHHNKKVYVLESEVINYIIARCVKYSVMKADRKRGYATFAWGWKDADLIRKLFNIEVPVSNKVPKTRKHRELVPLMMGSEKARKLYTTQINIQGLNKQASKLQSDLLTDILTTTEYKGKETADQIEAHWND